MATRHSDRLMRRLAIVALFVAWPASVWAQPPNHHRVVEEIFNRGGWDLTTKAGDGVFTEAVLQALLDIDPAWCHLRKTGSQNQWNGHAVDAVLYRTLGWSVDLIRDSESSQAAPAWTPDSQARYTPESCLALGLVGPPPAPSPSIADIIAALYVLDVRLRAVEERLVGLDVHLASIDGDVTAQTELLASVEKNINAKLDLQHEHHVSDEQHADKPWWVDTLVKLPAILTAIVAAIGVAN